MFRLIVLRDESTIFVGMFTDESRCRGVRNRKDEVDVEFGIPFGTSTIFRTPALSQNPLSDFGSHAW